MQQRDLDFAVWCAKKCVHLWDAPKEVKDWLNDPKPETARAADAAGAAWWAAKRAAEREAERAWWAADAAWWAAEAVEGAQAARGARAAAGALGVSIGQLRLEYVATWTNDELSQASGDWIEPATVEIFERRASRLRLVLEADTMCT